jgi:hypothetical protein
VVYSIAPTCVIPRIRRVTIASSLLEFIPGLPGLALVWIFTATGTGSGTACAESADRGVGGAVIARVEKQTKEPGSCRHF